MSVHTRRERTSHLTIAGPLTVSTKNPRYFAVDADVPEQERAVFLTGSHIWNNLQDGMGPGPECSANAEVFDYDAYLDFLKERGHNFIRLWRWEQFKSLAAGGAFHLCMAPQPWARTGPGFATDGKAKFDLERLDNEYFDRLRDRVVAAGNAGFYVGVMLFDGWALHLSPSPHNVEGHPFHADNNINSVAITSVKDYMATPLDAQVRAIQEAYIRQVVDTLHDLPNVLWEVANEAPGGGSVDQSFAGMLGLVDVPDWGDSTDWQYWVIDVVKDHEKRQGYVTHPIGMTMQFPVVDETRVNDPLYQSRAEWISPGYDDERFKGGGHPMAPGASPSRWYDNPPAGDGRKVVISDTDHFAPGKGDALWAWKSFLRGHHTILMDFGLIGGVNPADKRADSPGVPSFASFEPVRHAMGDTRRYAERVHLIDMTPRAELGSTGYVLANPGQEYLVLQPDEHGEPFKVELPAGTYSVEWYDIASRETTAGDAVRLEKDARITFTAPFAQRGPSVLLLQRT
jgi:hypothetical protein